MERENIKHAMYYGLLVSVAFILKFLAGTSTNGAMMAVNWLLALAIPVLAVYFAIDCRKKLNSDRFTYFQGFRYLMRLLFSASLVCTVFVFIYVMWISPDFLPGLETMILEVFDEMDTPVVPEMEEFLATLLEPKMYVMGQFIGYIMVSLFIALIGAFFTKKAGENPPATPQY